MRLRRHSKRCGVSEVKVFDLWDGLLLAGIGLVGAGVWLLWGVAVLLLVGGALLIAAALLGGGMRNGRSDGEGKRSIQPR